MFWTIAKPNLPNRPPSLTETEALNVIFKLVFKYLTKLVKHNYHQKLRQLVCSHQLFVNNYKSFEKRKNIN